MTLGVTYIVFYKKGYSLVKQTTNIDIPINTKLSSQFISK